MDTRKVQQVGYSTLAVSLPKDWAKEVGLSRGDVVTFKRESDQSLVIYPGIELEDKGSLTSIIKADFCNEKDLLTRIITGSYILGCDTINVVSKKTKELRPEHLEEVRNTTHLLTGIGIVEQTKDQVVIQSFVDPNKFPVEGLIRRLHIIASSMQLTAGRALFEKKPELTNEVIRMEEEANRIYWLIIRQLLLAQRGEAKIGLESPGMIVGDRVIAKTVETIADYSENMAREISKILDNDCSLYADVLEEIHQLFEVVQTISDKTIEALFRFNVKLANDVIETANLIREKERDLVDKIESNVSEVCIATPLRSMCWSLREISRCSEEIAEISINRSISRPNEFCDIERA